MRMLLPLVIAATAAACTARATPHAATPPDPSPWNLDTQPVPRTLDEALRALEQGLGERTIARLRIEEEDIAIRLVPTLGHWMEAHWGLATDGPLAQHFQHLGLEAPDDMAAVILTSLWRRLHFRDIRLDEQIAWYRATRQRDK
jgi:hypothetical protein